MIRLIDADSLKDKLVSLNDYKKACEIINNSPIIEVNSSVHWIIANNERPQGVNNMGNSELDQLIAQRKELDKRIRELSNPKYEVDGARMLLKKYKTGRTDEWVVALEEIDGVHVKASAYKQIISAKSRDDAIEYVETQIAILQALLDRVREGIHENNC